MGDKHSKSHIGKMEAVAQPNQRQWHNMMPDQLPEVLSGLFHPQTKNDCLLGPVCSLEKIVELEYTFVGLMREPFVHSSCVKIPYWRSAHDIQSAGTQDSEVDGGIHLFHKTWLLGPTLQATALCHWPQESLHYKFSCEGENNDIKRHKCTIP